MALDLNAASRAITRSFANHEMLRYALTSGAALVADVGFYAGAILVFGSPPALAAGLGFTIGLLVHHAIGRRYVFAAAGENRPDWRIFTEYALAGMAGIIWTTGVVAVLTAPPLDCSWLLAKAVAVASNFLLVFLLLKHVVFRARGLVAAVRPQQDTPIARTGH